MPNPCIYWTDIFMSIIGSDNSYIECNYIMSSISNFGPLLFLSSFSLQFISSFKDYHSLKPFGTHQVIYFSNISYFIEKISRYNRKYRQAWLTTFQYNLLTLWRCKRNMNSIENILQILNFDLFPVLTIVKWYFLAVPGSDCEIMRVQHL